MSRYFTEKITAEELEEKIVDSWKKHPSFKYYSKDDPWVWRLTDTIIKDLKKVSFDSGNLENHGYKTMSNGLTYLETRVGDDGECPITFMIYWDGSELRAYIPKEGNPWNTDKKMAYGKEYDLEADIKNAIKRGFIKKQDLEGKDEDEILNLMCSIQKDEEKISEDIMNRITFKEGKGPKKKHTKTSVESLMNMKVGIPPKDGTKQHYLIELVNIRNYDHNFVQLVEADDTTSINDKVRNIYKEAIKEDITRVGNYRSWTGNIDQFIEKNIFPNKQGFDFPGSHAIDLLDKMMNIPPIGSICYVDITPKQARTFEDLATSKKLRFGPFVYDASKKRVHGAMLMHVLLEIGYGNSKEIFDKLKNINHIFSETGDLEDFMYQFEE